MKTNQVIVVGQVWRSSQNGMVYDPRGVSPTICVGHHAGVEPKIIDSMAKPIDIRAVGRERTEEEKRRRHLHGDKGASFSKGKQTCILGDVSGCVTTFATKDNQVAEFYMEHQENKTGITLPDELEGKRFRIRKLTPRECFRLMGVDDSDIDKMQQAGISNSGQYKLAGNSIVVDVLYHIFRRMFIDTEEPDFDGNPTQLTLF